MSGARLARVPAHPAEAPPALLPYQQALVASTADPVVVYEKSRRIGISWAAASAAALASAASREAGGMDTLYIGYNLEMAREFIGDASFWSRHLHGFAAGVDEFAFDDDGERQIRAFRIRFASGFEIVALSARPRSLRGKQGFVIVDEAAFHDDLRALLKAAMALLMWGGRVWIVSTHDGADNPFNELVEDVRAGRKPFRLFRTTFAEAVAQGLHRRICLVNGWAWSADAEAAWVGQIRGYYGDDAAEELDAIPSLGSGVWLTRAQIDACMNPAFPVVYLRCEDGFEQRPDAERRAFVAAWLENEIDPLLARLDRTALGFLGGDFARSGDLTALWPGQLVGATLRAPFAVELRNMPFREQEQVLFHICDGMPRFIAGAVDARGLGAALAEYGAQRYGAERFAQVMATREWYRETMPGLKARFEDKTIEVPRDDDIRQDLRQVRVDKGVPMVPEASRVRSSRGGQRHGDAAIAAAMLHFASTLEVVDYGYEPARRVRRAVDEPAVDEPADDDEDLAGGSRLGRIRGAF